MPSYLRTEDNAQIVTAQSMGASFNGPAIDVNACEGFSIDARWSGGGTPVGELKLQVTNDLPTASSTVWTDMQDSATAVAGNSNSVVYNVSTHSYQQIRVVYTRTSGSASMDIILNRRSRRS